jgi:4'-phosphopantetheinyl transferase
MTEPENRSSENLFINPGNYSWELGSSVHVWKFPLIKSAFSLLTESEKELAKRFRFEGDRNRFAVGRQALRFLLSKYLDLKPEEISISAEKGQKPFISSPSSNIHFNITHSGEWVLIAIAKDELGIDIEKIDPEFEFGDLLREHFSEAEQSFISQAGDPVAAFYFLWTRKEALTKAWGTGLQENLKLVSVLDLHALIEIRNKFWKLETFNVSSDYLTALAFSSTSENIIYFDGTGILIPWKNKK